MTRQRKETDAPPLDQGRLGVLYEIGLAFGSIHELDRLLEVIVDSVMAQLNAEGASVVLLDEERRELFFRTADHMLGAAAKLKEIRFSVDQGITGWVVREGKPALVPDVDHDPRFYRGVDAETKIKTRSIVCVPLRRGDRTLGALSAINKRSGTFGEADLNFLTALAGTAAVAIENAQLIAKLHEARAELQRKVVKRTARLQQSLDELGAMAEIAAAVNSSLDEGEVLARIAVYAAELSGSDAAVIYEFEEATQTFTVSASHKLSSEFLATLGKMRIALGRGAIGRAGRERRPIHLPRIQSEPGYEYGTLLAREGFEALLAVPLLRGEELLGGMVVLRRTSRTFGEKEVGLLTTLANHSATALRHARLFRELGEKNQALEAASRHKSQFLANMSHELRTPMNAILGFADLILDRVYGAVPPALLEPLKDIRGSGQHLLRLINDVLDLSKIEAGRVELQMAEYSPANCIQAVLAGTQALAADKGLALTARVPETLPLVVGDEKRITQILLNLVGNAIKFTGEGRIEVGAELQDGKLLYWVADTGVGIPSDQVERIFDEFTQVDSSLTRKYQGTGLGLSISKKLVEMHGGQIWVEAEEGKGSTFKFTVPLSPWGGLDGRPRDPQRG